MKNFCNKVLHSICCYNDVSDIDNENTMTNHDNFNLNNANPNSLNPTTYSRYNKIDSKKRFKKSSCNKEI